MPGKPGIIIGLDFGTTYSGVAWALEGSPDSLEVITTWPGGGNRTSQKVPSTISYKDGDMKWGFQTPYSGDVLRAVKLLLDEGQGKSYDPARESKKIISKLNKDAVDVVGEYLQMIVSHSTQLLERRFGNTLDCMELKYVLTVPAVWSDKAKNSTLRAGTAAGIPGSNVSLVSEPEAAALHCLDSLTHTLKKDDAILVVDAGGGTVDLISYRIKKVNPLRLEEATEGTGAVCGSALLDEAFEELLKKLFGYREYMKIPEVSRNHAIQYWQEHVKPNYNGDMDFSIPFPGVKTRRAIRLEGGFLEMNNARIHSIFEPVIIDIQRLVRSQLGRLAESGRVAKAILLVGGFGSSEYLFDRLRAANPAIKVLQPPNAWSAVVRGSVQHQLFKDRIESRIARRHYGVKCSSHKTWLYNRQDRVWNDLEERWLVPNCMKWYIKKGASVLENERIKMPFQMCIRLGEIPLFTDPLYAFDDDDAPGGLSNSTYELCTLQADLSGIPKKLFEKKRNSKGVEYYRIPFDLVMTLTSGGIVFELEFNGVSYGKVEAQY